MSATAGKTSTLAPAHIADIRSTMRDLTSGSLTAARRILELRYTERLITLRRARIDDPARVDPGVAKRVKDEQPLLGNADHYFLSLLATQRITARKAKLRGTVLDDAWAALTLADTDTEGARA